MSILIQNALLVTQNTDREIKQGDIFIENEKISSIGKNLKEKAEIVIDAKSKIAMPGLVNTHTHVAMTLLRGVGEGLPLQQWLKEKIWPAEAKLTKEQVHQGALLGICEMLRSGITCFNEMYVTGLDEIATACEKVGIRVAIARGMFDLLPGRSIENEFKDAKNFVQKWKGNKFIQPAVSCHAPCTCSKELLIKAKEFANKEKLKFHMHVSETRKEIFDCLNKTKKYPLEYLDNLGLLDENSIFAHASWVTKREISLAGKKKLNIATCPVSNLKLATGAICPVREYHAAGANVTIGTDSAASNNSLNMFESMKLASLLQKHRYWKADVLPAQAFLDFATINGAKALGINSGSLEPGKLADIVLLDGKMPNLNPKHDLVANLVYSAGPQNVTDSIINGKLIMQDRKILTIDEEKTLQFSYPA